MTRAETGGLLLLAYSNMRGYGDIHPTIGELRVGFLPVNIKHPHTDKDYVVGEIKDHAPEQGQFKEIESFKNFFGTVYKKVIENSQKS
jgi:alpha-D-ribose 1-methylphosphonate 5-triphosphate synthase subunit PhnI